MENLYKATMVQILPMSLDEFKDMTFSEVQEKYFLSRLPSTIYKTKSTKSILRSSSKLILFQFNAQIIACALLKKILKLEYNKEYDIGYYFDPCSIYILRDPLNAIDMRGISKKKFNSFGQGQTIIDDVSVHAMVELLKTKHPIGAIGEYTFGVSEEDLYQNEVGKLSFDATDILDEPRYPVIQNPQSEKEKYGRSRRVASRAIKYANFKCEISSSHEHFKSAASNLNYVEAHHLVPMEYQRIFEYSLDVEANINSLCIVCHKVLHHGTLEAKESILRKLYDLRKERLKACNIEIDTFNQMLEYYQ